MLVQVRCPAKIHPRLKVMPKDETGYHPIETIYQAVGLFDSIEIETEVEKAAITTNWLDFPADNTLYKVLKFAREAYDLPPLKIHLKKRIPIGAGLGGSSSDAAGLIRVLGLLYPFAFPLSVQMDLAHAIGKNVPFFMHGGRAKGVGYGNIIETLEDIPSTWMCIVKPKVDISTTNAYKELDKKNSYSDDDMLNSFERVMPSICHELKDYLLQEQAMQAQLCGTGSAIYGIFLTKEQAQQAALLLVAKGFTQTFVVSTITKQESLWISYF